MFIFVSKESNMNILHVSGARSWGGNEQQLMYLVKELEAYPVSQKMFCYKGSPLSEELKNYPVEVLSIESAKPYSSAYRRFFKKIVEENDIDVIHLHTSDSVTGYVVTDMLHSLKTPTLFAKKGIRNKMGLLSKLKYNYKGIDKILCISNYVRKHFKEQLFERNHHKLVTVYNGVEIPEDQEAGFDLREKLGIGPETFLVGNIANHTNAKDLPTLIKTADYLVNILKVKDVHFVQIGKDSKLTSELKQSMRSAQLESYFTFMGFVRNASALLPQLDLFVMTSEREGGPSSIVEAFAHKTPVASTKVGVVEEVIIDGENGFVVEVGDYQGLAGKLQKFRNSPGLGKQFGERSYEIFQKKFTAGQLGKNTYEVYQSLAGDN